MNKILFTVPGEPCPWTVWTRRGPKPVGFENMEAWQNAIQVAAIRACGGKPLWEGPIKLEMEFWRQVPPSAPKKPDPLALWKERSIILRPDCMNYAKAAEDALKQIIFQDDSQVVLLIGSKHYAQHEPYTLIRVETDLVRPGDMDGVERLLKC